MLKYKQLHHESYTDIVIVYDNENIFIKRNYDYILNNKIILCLKITNFVMNHSTNDNQTGSSGRNDIIMSTVDNCNVHGDEDKRNRGEKCKIISQ
ncbi:Hypothetical protein SRAE_X000014400 [Strongyloides ratti]|uniref:Uncharacterized protein n=1 Tax=Strongyloides ratti TaxID=34506 RepID=A0A090LT84_STRRB|nr:Hypothetical protein SRAE_X000014400 [Strongyloides ratti]CEF70814.1 Hypothetical protein SRAE_X000014400 [Strongyloides ratti]